MRHLQEIERKDSNSENVRTSRRPFTTRTPISSVGVDCFGPWTVVTRRTRGGVANNKRWTVLLTRMSSRAIHIEVIEELSASSFINALRRFVSIRGKVQIFRSDRGTNFVGSTESLGINVESAPVKDFLLSNGTSWIFNPPHFSHMGGVWERMIGVVRRILDSLLLNVSTNNLTHEVLTTFLAETCAIVNSRPLVSVSSDPEQPFILSPAMLLTQKGDNGMSSLGDFDVGNIYKAQWQRVQALANAFWKRWTSEYLKTLQNRRKWREVKRDIARGDVVLLRDSNFNRNNWPIGIVTNVVVSDDGHVRKADVTIFRDGRHVTYSRPITEMIVLLEDAVAV